MKTYNRTCKCGAAFEAQDHRIKNCPACRAAKAAAEAARPLKICSKCGVEARIRRQRSCCDTCYQQAESRRLQQMRADVIERRRREFRERQAKQEEPSREQRIRTYLDEFAELSAEEKAEHFVVALKWVLQACGDTSIDDAEDVNPEEQPHANQAAIDAAFRNLMQDVDL